MAASRFNIARNVQGLETIYASGVVMMPERASAVVAR
jgi:hypothetical protein